MNFKKPKEQVVNDAHIAADITLTNGFYAIKNNYMNSNQTYTFDNLQFTISQAIRSAIQSIVNDTYTDQEFEEDLSLKEKT